MLDVGIQRTDGKGAEFPPLFLRSSRHLWRFVRNIKRTCLDFTAKLRRYEAKICKKAPNFNWSALEPFPGATVWFWGTFGWSATIASVGPLQGLQVKSIALEHRLHCEGEGFLAAQNCLSSLPQSEILVVVANMPSRGLVKKSGDTTCQVRVRELG